MRPCQFSVICRDLTMSIVLAILAIGHIWINVGQRMTRFQQKWLFRATYLFFRVVRRLLSERDKDTRLAPLFGHVRGSTLRMALHKDDTLSAEMALRSYLFIFCKCQKSFQGGREKDRCLTVLFGSVQDSTLRMALHKDYTLAQKWT